MAYRGPRQASRPTSEMEVNDAVSRRISRESFCHLIVSLNEYKSAANIIKQYTSDARKSSAGICCKEGIAQFPAQRTIFVSPVCRGQEKFEKWLKKID